MDDNPADIDLTRDILGRSPCRSHIHSVLDGMKAMEFLLRKGGFDNAVQPDLVLLDLNLPAKDGRSVLKEVKADPVLRKIPIVIFSTSRAREDIQRCYELGANCYINKPGNLQDFVVSVNAVADFWLCHSLLPAGES